MKKKEAMEYIRHTRGFIPSITIFEIYEDEDEIPEGVIEMFTRVPPKRTITINTGYETYLQIKEVYKEHYERETRKN